MPADLDPYDSAFLPPEEGWDIERRAEIEVGSHLIDGPAGAG